jgi:hypothetical protein
MGNLYTPNGVNQLACLQVENLHRFVASRGSKQTMPRNVRNEVVETVLVARETRTYRQFQWRRAIRSAVGVGPLHLSKRRHRQ